MVLKKWDKTLDTSSRGSVLFVNWYNALKNEKVFEVKFSKEKPTQYTPHTYC